MFWVFILIGISVWLVPAILTYVGSKRKTSYVVGLVNNNFIDSKVLFITRFKEVPSVSVITQVDVTKAYAFIRDTFGEQVVEIHQSTMFDYNEGRSYFNMTIMELTNKRLIELGNGYVEVIFTSHDCSWANSVIADLSALKMEANVMDERTPTVIGFARTVGMN